MHLKLQVTGHAYQNVVLVTTRLIGHRLVKTFVGITLWTRPLDYFIFPRDHEIVAQQ